MISQASYNFILRFEIPSIFHTQNWCPPTWILSFYLCFILLILVMFLWNGKLKEMEQKLRLKEIPARLLWNINKRVRVYLYITVFKKIVDEMIQQTKNIKVFSFYDQTTPVCWFCCSNDLTAHVCGFWKARCNKWQWIVISCIFNMFFVILKFTL